MESDNELSEVVGNKQGYQPLTNQHQSSRSNTQFEPITQDQPKISVLDSVNDQLRELKKANGELLMAFLQLKQENDQLKRLLNNQDVNNSSDSFDMPRKIPKKQNLNTTSVCTNNVHESVMDTGHTDAQMISAPATSININNNNNHNNLPISSVVGLGKKKIFQAVDTNLSVVRSSIKKANCNNFTIKQANAKVPIKITVQDAGEVAHVRDALAKNNISFHEFKLHEEKNKCFLIRGLVGATAECLPEIKQELVSAGIPAEASLSIFITGHMRANPALLHNTILKLVVPPNFDDKVLQGIKYINHVAVKFVAFKSPTIVQCKNCQRFGHSAGGCQHKHRCVKCGEDHLRDSCPRTFNKAVKLRCCNCGGEHSANNLSICSYFAGIYPKKSAVEARSVQLPKGASVNLPMSNVPSGMTKIRANQTFASVTKGPVQNVSVSASKKPSDQVLGHLAELSKKIDVIYALVLKHDAAIQGLIGHD